MLNSGSLKNLSVSLDMIRRNSGRRGGTRWVATDIRREPCWKELSPLGSCGHGDLQAATANPRTLGT
jgi:hypothetical protein